tara:strand:- start:3475 stop:4155 length:681 start_codon:yes stop_codon:yes gene_type:complete
MKKILSIFLVLIVFQGCAALATETKLQAFPGMYDERQPLSILVVPAINKTTAAEASEFFNISITEPLSNSGYYTMPVEIVRDIFLKEGVVDSSMIINLPMSVFKNSFGADAVLFVTINQWDKNYIVIAGNVTVGMDYVMKSTDSGEILWQYSATTVLNTSGDSGFFLTDIITTAINTAAANYLPVAMQANYQAFTALPHGKYSKLHRQDGDVGVVYKVLKDKASNQ